MIVIAPTTFSNRETEKVTIVERKNGDKTIVFKPALSYSHYAATQSYGAKTIDMRAEVGLLSRNVIFRGDPITSQRD